MFLFAYLNLLCNFRRCLVYKCITDSRLRLLLPNFNIIYIMEGCDNLIFLRVNVFSFFFLHIFI